MFSIAIAINGKKVWQINGQNICPCTIGLKPPSKKHDCLYSINAVNSDFDEFIFELEYPRKENGIVALSEIVLDHLETARVGKCESVTTKRKKPVLSANRGSKTGKSVGNRKSSKR